MINSVNHSIRAPVYQWRDKEDRRLWRKGLETESWRRYINHYFVHIPSMPLSLIKWKRHFLVLKLPFLICDSHSRGRDVVIVGMKSVLVISAGSTGIMFGSHFEPWASIFVRSAASIMFGSHLLLKALSHDFPVCNSVSYIKNVTGTI